MISNAIDYIVNNINSILLLLLGSLIGVLLSQIIDYIKLLRKYWQYKKRYSKYEGVYLAYDKYDEGDGRVFRCIKLIREKNKFIIKQGISVSGHEDFDAEILMNESNPDYGTGYYQHNLSFEKIVRFGFIEFQLAQNAILVHETIYDKKGTQNSDARRWIKQDPKKEEYLFTKYRAIQQENRQNKLTEYRNRAK